MSTERSKINDLDQAVGGLQIMKNPPEGDPGWGRWMNGGGAGDFSVEGTEVLYYGVFLREYDETGTIVPVGSETTPLPEGHTLKPTWDVARWI